MRRLLITLTGVLLVGLFVALPASPSFADAAQHAAITITSNADFSTCACVTGGSGTASSPYVIGPWTIKAPSGGTSGWSVKVDNSKGKVTAFFTITGIASAYNDTTPSDPDIWLVDVTNPTTISGGSNSTSTTANDNGTGVELDGSSNITLTGLQYNKMNGPGVFLNGSSFVTLDNSKLKSPTPLEPPHNQDGVYALNSSNIKIGTSSSCPNNMPCVSLDYDGGFGVYLQNTHDVVINSTSASAEDTGGYVLDGTNTFNVTLQNSASQGTGPICITINGQKQNTGYVSDLQGGVHLINGTHNNTITADTFAANTGFSIASGGNGFYLNACTGVNQPFSPVEDGMGANNTFSNNCYSTTNIPGLPASTGCKS